ncbi:MAG: hypothetical protein ABI873_03110 [Marmoricola sp.]
MSAEVDLMSTLFTCLDERRWDDVRPLLADGFEGTYTHTGERLDRDGFVRFQVDYPVRVRLAVEEVVAQGEHAVVRARVFSDEESHHVASFGTTSGGLLVSLVEVWAEDTGGTTS